QPPAGVFPMAGPGQPLQAAGSTGTSGTARLTPSPAGRGAAGNGSGNGVPGQAARRPATVLSGGSAAAALGASAAGQQARPGYTPSGAKIGRNDICWCGSGLKYKKCHGR